MVKKFFKWLLYLLVSGIIIISVYNVILVAVNWKETQRDFKHRVSSTIGLNRTVYEQDYTRKVINQWEGRISIEHTPSGISFIDAKGKVINLSMPYKVVEN